MKTISQPSGHLNNDYVVSRGMLLRVGEERFGFVVFRSRREQMVIETTAPGMLRETVRASLRTVTTRLEPGVNGRSLLDSLE